MIRRTAIWRATQAQSITAVIYALTFATLMAATSVGNVRASVIPRTIPGMAAVNPLGRTQALTVAQGPPARIRIESELITITPQGFDTNQITRPKGKFFLFVDNRSGLDSVTLRIDRLAGNRLVDEKCSKEKLDWDGIFDLNPGEYVLTEAAHPGWICHITITPQ